MSKIKTACIIDDDPIYILTTRRMMQQADLSEEILVFNNGKQAIEGLHQIAAQGGQLPEIILLDLNMPVMDGWQFLEEYKASAIAAHTEIYIVSSSIDPEDLKRAHLTPCVKSYLTKPLTKLMFEEMKAGIL